MNFQHHKERAQQIADIAPRWPSGNENVTWTLERLSELADIVADLCDDLTPSAPPAGECRRGMWLQDASRWYLLVEQDDDEIWWAVRFDSIGIASPKLCTLMPNSPDYQRCEAPEWWAW